MGMGGGCRKGSDANLAEIRARTSFRRAGWSLDAQELLASICAISKEIELDANSAVSMKRDRKSAKENCEARKSFMISQQSSTLRKEPRAHEQTSLQKGISFVSCSKGNVRTPPNEAGACGFCESQQW